MERVNPPRQVVLPPKVAQDENLKKAFDDVYYILFQLWRRTGAGADFVDQSVTGLYEFDDAIQESVKKELQDDVVVTNSDYTTCTDQLIICTDRVTITLNDTPENQELAKVRAVNGEVIINGNGRNINGKSTARIKRNYTSWDIMYIIETDEWVIV